jgi:hypothetical protein
VTTSYYSNEMVASQTELMSSYTFMRLLVRAERLNTGSSPVAPIARFLAYRT